MFDFSFMQGALAMARCARAKGRVPVGAVVVKDRRVVARAHNDMFVDACVLPEPLRHAEILAMAIACKVLSVRRLDGCQLYVTLEPCPFCWGALSLMHVSKVVFGAFSPDSGIKTPAIEVLGGILESETSKELALFFQEKRQNNEQYDRLSKIRGGAKD